MTISKTLSSAATLLALASSAACSKQQAPASLNFLPGSSAGQVVVEAADLNDTFLFGTIVTDTDASASALLGASTMLAQEVQLGITQGDNGDLLTIQSTSGDPLLSFAVSSESNGRAMVNFARAADAVDVLSTLDPSLAQGASSARVSKVAQTRDSMTVDVAYTGDIPTATGETTTGHYSVRYWWKRRQPNANFAQRANIDGLGYFTTANQASGQGLRDGSISRLDLSQGPISFTLVGFPANLVDAATQGIKAWESALGANTLSVHVGSGNVGDPNTVVVRWYTGLPSSVPFAGLTYAAADPETGERGASAVLINSFSLDRTNKIFAGTQAAYLAFKNGTPGPSLSSNALATADSLQSTPLALRLGHMTLAQNALMQDDAPVFLPGLFDETETADAYIKGYYRDVIMHEVGHVMGLRHNFRGSLHPDANGVSQSIMDYAGNQNADKATTIGAYDVAAIRYGYFGETPAQTFDFCSDEDQANDALCNQFDAGADLVTYFHKSTQQIIDFTSHYDFDPLLGLTGVASTFKLYYKLTQLPSSMQAAASANLQADLAALNQAVGQTAVQNANLKALRERAVVLTGGTFTPPPL